MIKIMIVDDQQILRDGLETMIQFQEDMDVVAMAKNGSEAVTQLEQCSVDLILMDIRMPIMDGVLATKAIKEKWPNIKIIILTTFDDDEYIIKAMGYGAEGYLLKDIPGEALMKAIRDAMSGNLLLPGKVAVKLASHLMEKGEMEKKQEATIDTAILTPFSRREIDVANLIAKGFTNQEIADALFISEGTVKNYVSNIYDKIQIKERPQAIRFLQAYFKSHTL